MQSEGKSFQLTKNICNHVVVGDMTSEDYQYNIKSLLEICNGPTNKSGAGFCKALNSEELLLALLRVKKSIAYLEDEPELSVEVIKILLKFSRIPWDVVYSLTNTILLSKYVNKDELKITLWGKKGTASLPSKFYSLLVKEDPKLLENYIYEIYHSYSNINTDIWKDKEHRWFINWCSQLPEGFQISAYILNQFLIYSKFKEYILKIIKDFICNVMNECARNSRDFVLLYPIEFQSLASLLILEPSYSPLKKDLLERLAKLEKSNPSMVLLLYSHFPEWIKV